MEAKNKIYISGHKGLLGSAILRNLKSKGYNNIITKTREQLDLSKQKETFDFFKSEKPEFVFICAAKVGGILANKTNPTEFLYENLCIQNNLIRGSQIYNAKKVLFVGSSCIYPTNCPNPITEDQILTGPFEPTNEAYALAKVSGIRMCQYINTQYGLDFISAIPCNLFGVNDRYNLKSSHLLPALIHKIHLAKQNKQASLEVWGSGKPRREFMLSDDCADALVFLMLNYSSPEPVNIGHGIDFSIKEWAENVMQALNMPLDIILDPSKPDGIYQKLLDINKLKSLGWEPKLKIKEDIKTTHNDFLNNFWNSKNK